MKILFKIKLSLIVFSVFISFKLVDSKLIEFSYPNRNHTTINLSTDKFKKFSKEWRGSDYYYFCNNKDGFICSILYYKLNDEEKRTLVDAPKMATNGPEMSPVYPFAYFSTNSKFKKEESGNENWGSPTDDFMFLQNTIKEFQGIKVNQKNMYAYAMVDKDLFVKVHLSKIRCSANDSTIMRQILSSLSLKK